MLEKGLPLPDLIVIDGGKGQISAAMDVLDNELDLDIPICGLKKDREHRTDEILFGPEAVKIDLAKNSEAFYLLQRVQDEVHRFAIDFHRQVKSKNVFTSELDQVKGVGEKRRQAILRHFGSIEAVRRGQLEDFRQIGISEDLAKDILKALKK